ncbi:hypothetical protein EZV62_023646 [Acer yangbiense]|uniref:Transposase MuDR plant domain-containing protein n=1 Tax=Acer yangbiense TaxID=1000413 RepID=A0A5C7H3R5_9ROSI|nr:hypothetical protein EZV62_023646 [Acer yangbiense]
MESFKIYLQSGVNQIEVGECDTDHISLITLIHAICEKLNVCSDVPTGEYHVWAQIPWSGEKYGVLSDGELLELFSLFEERGLDSIVFELEDLCYIPTPPEEPQVLDMEGGYEPLGWCNMEYREVPIVEQESVDGDDGITEECMDGFEGYQSKSDDEYFTDSKLEPEQVRIAKCTGDGCKWRAHGSCMIDGVTFMLKTLSDQHYCHRVYNNKEAKVKWITSKFENLVKRNPSIEVKVIGDLLRENYKVSVEIQKLYRAKHGALKELVKEHVNWFRYLRRNLTFMSDRQKGVIIALQLHFPFAHRRYCARQIYANFKLTFKGTINPAAKKWLEEIDSQHWSRFAYDPVIRCDHVTNNMIEAFNSMLGSHRAASYLDMLEFIRRMVIRKFNERKEECRGWTSVLPPRVHAKILKHSKESMTLTMIAVGNMEYELLGPTGGYAVKLREYNC